jgi:hypothetical protein
MSFALMNASVLWMDRRHYGIKFHVLNYWRPMIPSPAALVVAHPGHELRVHRWLEIARPLVFVITDGSGSGRSRIRSTIEALGATGCTAGSIMGAFTDQEIYRLMLTGEVDPIVAMTIELAESLLEHDIRSVVADAFEFYSPTHDLCSVIATLAAQLASTARYEYAVTEAPSPDGETLELDAAALARKLAAANRCEDLKAEADGLIDRIGVDALRREVFRPVSIAIDLPKLASKPFYETHGEKRVAEGHYREVIRYEQHFRPFVEKLIAAVQAPAAHA